MNGRNRIRLLKSILFIHNVQFLLTKNACDEHLCIIVPCIGENW